MGASMSPSSSSSSGSSSSSSSSGSSSSSSSSGSSSSSSSSGSCPSGSPSGSGSSACCPGDKMVRRNNEDVVAECKKGDLIEFTRGGFSHWAVYVGHGRVIHLTVDTTGTGKITEERFWDVVGDNKAKINNYLDGKISVFPKKKIVKRARSKLGNSKYNLVSYNCEHFATWCRYGEARSQQVIDVTAKAQAFAVATVAPTWWQFWWLYRCQNGRAS